LEIASVCNGSTADVDVALVTGGFVALNSRSAALHREPFQP